MLRVGLPMINQWSFALICLHLIQEISHETLYFSKPLAPRPPRVRVLGAGIFQAVRVSAAYGWNISGHRSGMVGRAGRRDSLYRVQRLSGLRAEMLEILLCSLPSWNRHSMFQSAVPQQKASEP